MKPESLFPAFLKLAGRRCVVVGAGPIGEEKTEGLLRAQADVVVVAPQATARIKALAKVKKIRWEARPFQATDFEGAFLIVAATSSSELHHRIYEDAKLRGILCNVVDDPPNCDFYYGSVVQRGSLQIAISTAGKSPALAQRIRKQLERQFGPEYESWIERLGAAREKLFSESVPPQELKALLHELASESSFEAFLKGRKKRSNKRTG
jgi:precorrin-2 dehydrogenase/sirohydrochlorin ferrochelatase